MAKCGICGVDVTFDIVQYYVPDFEGKKHRICKACSVSANGKALKYDPASGRVIVVEKSEIEVRKKCNVCGNVFCYNPVDIDLSKKKQGAAIMTALTGHYAASAIQQSTMTMDYDKCPKCGSKDLRMISKEEFAAEMNYNRSPQSAAPQISAADELKKYKELLDIGAITQEEFDEKKRQLLHGVVPVAQEPANVVPMDVEADNQCARETEGNIAAQVEQNCPESTKDNKWTNNLPKILFWVCTILGIRRGFNDVYFNTNQFKSVYRGVLMSVVGKEEYVSAIFAGVIWLALAAGVGFGVAKITESILKKNK